LLLFDAEKATLAEIAYRLGGKALEGLAAAAKPDTLLGLAPNAHRPQVRRLKVS